MKTKVLIIEDNVHKFFATKQVLEAQLNMKVKAVDVADSHQLLEAVGELAPDTVMFRPCGIAELLLHMQKRKTNRRNTEITLMVAEEMDDELTRRLQTFFAAHPKRIADAA